MPRRARSSMAPNPQQRHVLVFRDRESLLQAAAECIAGIAVRAIADHGRFSWALSGGSTPRELYRRLAGAGFAARIEWRHVHFFWSDERCVPPDHADSNYRMAREMLLDAIHPLPEQVHRMHGEANPREAAAAYERVLREQLDVHGDGLPPRLDLVLLGMGADGHTASLFPGIAAPSETRHWVVASEVPESRSPRLSLTPAIINAAARIIILVSGPDKAQRLAQVLGAEPAAPRQVPVPVQLIQPVDGELCWLVDAAAAAHLGQVP